ncbi:MAG: HD domain-containing protein [Clostridia bacterium]|nr:HD domain-containing protein [Clostridia bacterium]
MNKLFEKEKADENNPKWQNMISREQPLYVRNNSLRSEFERDYTRIINSNGYKRLKHKTQVFFRPKSDHICTRSEHVTLVESISHTLAHNMGLNEELTKAIATAHDIGHSPFGHAGEKILSQISQRDCGCTFWHERNGINMLDNIELLEDLNLDRENLNLTYAVRDGVISHCGEIDENSLKPRDEFINLYDYTYPNQYAPYTWEGCVVKVSDKISYICRDIEDAIRLHIIDNELDDLYNILKLPKGTKINNTTIVNELIYDLYQNSTPKKGLCFSKEKFDLLNNIKKFNYEKIYGSKKVRKSDKYFSLIINEFYELLKSAYDGSNTLEHLRELQHFYPTLIETFIDWISCYWNLTDRTNSNLKNKIIFNIDNKQDYYKAIIYFISGMTDNFAIDTYMEMISF